METLLCYRQAGEGLGKAGQGIAAPIEGLVKALPPVRLFCALLCHDVAPLRFLEPREKISIVVRVYWTAVLYPVYGSSITLTLLFLLLLQGLSLDYISEMTKAKPLGQSYGSEDALTRRSAEIKMDIVARFNAAQQSGSGGQKSLKRKHAATVQPVRENNVFGFLNNMEVNKPIQTPGMNSNSRGSGGSGSGAGGASAQRATVHKTTNISKLF